MYIYTALLSAGQQLPARPHRCSEGKAKSALDNLGKVLAANEPEHTASARSPVCLHGERASLPCRVSSLERLELLPAPFHFFLAFFFLKTE